jgi:anti-sigma factor RsiW
MTTPTPNPSATREHDLAWNDRLQDWLDGDLDPTEAATLQAHMSGCASCRARAEELQALDRSLVSALPRLALDDAFDARIFAQLDAIDESKRADTRRRMEQELQQNLRALARGWRRSVLVILSGVVAGVALALGLASWLSDASLMHTLIARSAAEFGPGNSAQVQVIAMTLLGAGVGGVIARWLATVVE